MYITEIGMKSFRIANLLLKATQFNKFKKLKF